MDFIHILEFFENLEFQIDVIYQNYNKETKDSLYLLNGEPVYIETKNEVRPQHVNTFLINRNSTHPLMVASKYITPNAKSLLKKKNINYIDSFGNAYINLNRIKLYIEKGNAKPISNKNSNIFTQSSGQIIFNFLKNPELVNATQRFLAHISKVSLGSVSNTLHSLIEEGYLVKWNNEQKYQLVNIESLLDKWIIVLNEKVLPAHKIGNFTFSKINAKHWRDQLMHPNILWSGEAAAALITDYLNPEEYSLFTHLPKSEIIRDLKLIPDEKGEIAIYKPFWMETDTMDRLVNYMNNQNAVHPLIIYAELIYTNNSRNMETAQIIYDDYIHPYL